MDHRHGCFLPCARCCTWIKGHGVGTYVRIVVCVRVCVCVCVCMDKFSYKYSNFFWYSIFKFILASKRRIQSGRLRFWSFRAVPIQSIFWHWPYRWKADKRRKDSKGEVWYGVMRGTYSTVLCCIVLYCIVLYCIILSYIV